MLRCRSGSTTWWIGTGVSLRKLFLKLDFDVTVAGAKLTGKAELDPWLIGGGGAYGF